MDRGTGGPWREQRPVGLEEVSTVERKHTIPLLKALHTGTFTATGTLISLIVIAGVALVMLFSRITVNIGPDKLEVSAPMAVPVTVPYCEINEVRLLDSLEVGESHRSVSNPAIMAGTYVNDAYTIYDLFVYKGNTTSYIEVRYRGSVYLILNLQSEPETRSLYETIKGTIGQLVEHSRGV